MAESPVSAEVDQPTSAPESSPQSFRERALNRLTEESNAQPQAEKELENQAEPLSENTDLEDEADQLDDTAEADSDSEEQPEEDDAPRVFEIDGNEFTEDDIRNLVADRRKWDVEFRKRTQQTASLKKNYEQAGANLAVQQKLIMDAAAGNLDQLKQVDPTGLTQDQYAMYQQNLKQAQAQNDHWAKMFSEANQGLKAKFDEFQKAQADESVEVLRGIEPRWNENFYGDLKEFAVETGRYSDDEFKEIADWRVIEGLIALRDAESATQKLEKVKESKSKPNRRRQRARQRNRNAQGQFQSARDAVFESPNAKRDGSFRAMMEAKLAAERGS